jgi:hypothetical protein
MNTCPSRFCRTLGRHNIRMIMHAKVYAFTVQLFSGAESALSKIGACRGGPAKAGGELALVIDLLC